MNMISLALMLALLSACHAAPPAAGDAPASEKAAAAPEPSALALTSASAGTLFQLLGQVEGKAVIGYADFLPKTDSITVPAAANVEDLREFVENYLKLHNLVLKKQGDKLIVTDMVAYHKIWIHDIGEGLRQSEALKKPLLVKLEAGWCSACRLQDRTFHSEEIIRKELEKFVLAKLDVTSLTDGSTGGRELTPEEKMTSEFLDKYEMNGRLSLPALVIIDKVKGVKVLNGYFRNPEKVKAQLLEAMQ